jgi:NADPH:quinone reductase-like Zn-dependent oxidoreductase
VLVVRPGVWNNEVVVSDKHLFPVPGNLSKEQLASVDVVASAIGILNFGGLAAGDVIVLDNATDVLNAAIVGIAKSRKFRALVQQSGGGFVSATDTDKVDVASLKAKLIVTSQTGAAFNQLAGLLAFGGSVVSVNGIPAPIPSASGVSASVRNLVFNDLRIHGADFTSWAHANPISCANAVAEAARLLSAGQITLPSPKNYASNDAVAALDAAAQGQLVSITF